MPTPRNVEVLRDSAPEQKKGILNHLNRHKGKYLLGLAALAGGTYGLGRLGTAGMLANTSTIGTHAPRIAAALRPLSAHASRFTHLTDGVLQRAPFGARWASTFQTPTDGAGREFIRGQINAGEVPTRPSQIP